MSKEQYFQYLYVLFYILIISLILVLIYLVYSAYFKKHKDTYQTNLNQNTMMSDYGYGERLSTFSNTPTPEKVAEFKKVKYICTFIYFSIETDSNNIDIYKVSNNFPEYIQQFVSDILPQINQSERKFKLVLCHGDWSVSRLWDSVQKILESKQLVSMYSVNCDKRHPKLFPIPIGLDYHTDFWSSSISPKSQESKLVEFQTQLPSMEKRNLSVYVNAHLNLTDTQPLHNYVGNRKYLFDKFNSHPLFYFELTPIPRDEVWKKHGQHLFIASPPGNGLDCHRTWEAMILGSIPIILSTELDPLFDNLPVVIVKKWEEITEDNLRKWRQSILSRKYDLKKLEQQYWVNFISK